MQNSSKYVPLHLRNQCNGVPSVHIDNDKKFRVIGFDPNSVRVMQNGKHVPRNPVRQIDCCNYILPHLRNLLHGVPLERKNKTIEVVTDDDRANLDADQGFDDTENADQVTESGNKNVVNNRADQEAATNTDTSDQETTAYNKRTSADMTKSTKMETDNVKNDDEDHHFHDIEFIVRMNGINSHARFFYQDLF